MKNIHVPLYYPGVSILVFMEVALDQYVNKGMKSYSTFCFNPCFHGSSSRSHSRPVDIAAIIGFNPCFHGSSSRSFVVLHICICNSICFNPCFHGSSSRSLEAVLCYGCLAVFQSLFSWK